MSTRTSPSGASTGPPPTPSLPTSTGQPDFTAPARSRATSWDGWSPFQAKRYAVPSAPKSSARISPVAKVHGATAAGWLDGASPDAAGGDPDGPPDDAWALARGVAEDGAADGLPGDDPQAATIAQTTASPMYL